MLLTNCAALAPEHGQHSGEYYEINSPEAAADYAEQFDTEDNTNQLINAQEAARLYQLAGDFSQSRQILHQALELYTARDYDAVITLEDSKQLAALVTNDKVIPYAGSDYERVFARLMQSMNYLSLGDVDKALVEMRAGANDQRFAEEARDKKVEQAEIEQREKHLAQADQGQLQRLAALAGDKRNAFLNAYMYYYSSLLREAAGDANGAYIDIRKSWELAATNPYLAQSLVNLAGRFDPGNRQRYQELTGAAPQTLPQGHGRLVLLIERGFAPPREAFEFHLELYYINSAGNFTNTLVVAAMPTYYREFRLFPPVSVTANGQSLPSRHLMSSYPLAANQLKEAMPAIMLRQVTRMAAKQVSNEKAKELISESKGSAAKLLTGVLVLGSNIITEQADTRSWVSLPEQVDNWETALPAGTHDIALDLGGGRIESLSADIQAGGLHIIRVIDTGLFARVDRLYPVRQ